MVAAIDEVVGSNPCHSRLNEGSTHSCYLCQTKSMSDDNFQTEQSERKRCLLSRCSSFSGWRRRRSLDWKMIIMFIVSTRMRRIRTLQSIDIRHHWRGWTKQKCIQRPPLKHKNKYFLILLQGWARNGSTKWICLLARSVSDPPTFDLI